MTHDNPLPEATEVAEAISVMINRPRGFIAADFVQWARDGDAPGCRLLRSEHPVLGKNPEVLIFPDGRAYELRPDETPIREGYINMVEMPGEDSDEDRP